MWEIHNQDCLHRMRLMETNSVDAIVTDPPYELGFMGKKWDSTGIAFNVEVWEQALRVLKPGGHLLAFGGSRTWHRLAVAIEDAGFEVRDSIAWLYGSGFPKSLDISKAIDKAAGAEREVVGSYTVGGTAAKGKHKGRAAADSDEGSAAGYTKELSITAPATPEAEQWQGWGTALKPAFEPVVVARKPLVGTVAANVLKFGTGGLNIDGTRIGTNGGTAGADAGPSNGIYGEGLNGRRGEPVEGLGRWPANVILDETTAELLNQQSGVTVSKSANRGLMNSGSFGGTADTGPTPKAGTESVRGHDDVGGASRFFYVAKASKRDRNEGLQDLEARLKIGYSYSDQPNDPANGMFKDRETQARNFHPTVKPTALMRYLIRLVTPAGGTVFDPFTGSGSTGKAALLEGFNFIGTELNPDYIPIINARLAHAEKTAKEQLL